MAYQQVQANEVPEGIRFDVPARNQGQIIEVAYGDRMELKAENDAGAPWKRVTDTSLPPSHPERVTYYRRVAK